MNNRITQMAIFAISLYGFGLVLAQPSQSIHYCAG